MLLGENKELKNNNSALEIQLSEYYIQIEEIKEAHQQELDHVLPSQVALE